MAIRYLKCLVGLSSLVRAVFISNQGDVMIIGFLDNQNKKASFYTVHAESKHLAKTMVIASHEVRKLQKKHDGQQFFICNTDIKTAGSELHRAGYTFVTGKVTI